MTMLYLSRLTLNPRMRRVQRDLADCYAMHQRVLSAFPDSSQGAHARERFGVLYRVDERSGELMALVQSREAPNWSRLPNDYLTQAPLVKQIAPLYEALHEEMLLVFRLRANTVKRISDRAIGQREQWRGKRIDLRNEQDQLEWLSRKSRDAGFRLVAARARPGLAYPTGKVEQIPEEVGDVRVADGAVVHGTQQVADGGRRKLTFGATIFDGRLIVTDVDRFKRTLEDGIGPAKAFGFGLLSVMPALPQGS